MAIKENVLPLAQDSGSGYIRTVSSGGASQRTAFDTVKGAITADMDEAIADEVDAREAADNQLQTEIDGKVDKVTGKGLSTNDFTNALKTKLDGIEAGAEVNVIETVKVNGTALVPDANRAVNVPAPTVDSALSTTSENPVQNKVITGEISDLKEDFAFATNIYNLDNWVNGGIITNSGTVDITDIRTDSTMYCQVIPCSEADKFVITGTGDSSGRLWCFIDSSGTILANSSTSVTLNNALITAPANTAYLVVNVKRASDHVLYSGDWCVERINMLMEQSIYKDKIIVRNFVNHEHINTAGYIDAYSGSRCRSAMFVPIKGGQAYKSDNANETRIYCYDENMLFLDWFTGAGTANLPDATKYAFIVVLSTDVTSVTLTPTTNTKQITEKVYLDLGGISDSGINRDLGIKNPWSYKRTTSYIPIDSTYGFKIQFTSSVVTVFEYDKNKSFIKKTTATTNAWIIPDETTRFIKIESYLAPTLLFAPSINVGNKYAEYDGGEWIYTTDQNRCYTDPITVYPNKQYLIAITDSDVTAGYDIVDANGDNVRDTGWMNDNLILDFWDYAAPYNKYFIRGRKSNGNFAESDTPFSVYDLTENTLEYVTLTYNKGLGSKYNKYYDTGTRPIIYKVDSLLGGESVDTLCYNAGLLRLPPNYTPDGDPVPLIYFAHGSSDYANINVGTLNSAYSNYMTYLVDEGFAVFDCYGWCNILSFAGGGHWAGHLNMSAVVQGIEHVCKNYNIDINHVFASCKSLGGLQAFNIQNYMDVKAIGNLAPAVDSYESCLGYTYLQRKAMFYDLGLDPGTDDENILFAKNTYMYNAPSDFTDVVLDKPNAICGYNPAWLNMIGVDSTALINAEINGTSFQSGALNVANIVKTKARVNKSPVKIWAASDDNAISYRLCNAYVTSVINAGGNAVMRTMPDNTGGHHSVDTDPNALKVGSIVTRLGITCTDVPLAYVELVEWFREFM